jgi:hypothetical protein
MPWQTSDGRFHSGSYESWIDRQIREAQERGEFDDLPGAGQPLERPGRPDDPDWWIKERVARENLDLSLGLPPQLRLRKEAEGLRDRVLTEPTEQAARDLVEDFNARVRESWATTLEGPLRPAKLVDVDELISHWRDHRARLDRSAAETSAMPTQQPQRRGWLLRLLRR